MRRRERERRGHSGSAAKVTIMWWVIVCIFFGVPLIIGAIAQIQKSRRASLARSNEPDDFLNDAHPITPSSPWGKASRLR
jgi:hypothetical protein